MPETWNCYWTTGRSRTSEPVQSGSVLHSLGFWLKWIRLVVLDRKEILALTEPTAVKRMQSCVKQPLKWFSPALVLIRSQCVSLGSNRVCRWSCIVSHVQLTPPRGAAFWEVLGSASTVSSMCFAERLVVSPPAPRHLDPTTTGRDNEEEEEEIASGLIIKYK